MTKLLLPRVLRGWRARVWLLLGGTIVCSTLDCYDTSHCHEPHGIIPVTRPGTCLVTKTEHCLAVYLFILYFVYIII